VDYSYAECTSAVIQALARARARFPGYREAEICRATRRGERFLRHRQRPDGSWLGSWAVCFTYGTWFGVSGLLAAGASSSDPALQRACDFLERHQHADGSWGEAADSCIEGRYIERTGGHVVNTAWALSALVRCGRGQGDAARRAGRYLVDTQLPNGDWPHQGMIGVFNKTALIDYDNYRRYFPIWALSEHLQSR
jgi:squalene cyclase